MPMQVRTLLVIAILTCAALSAQAAPVAYAPDAEGFIRNWLIAGPYPNPRAEPEPAGFSGDLLPHMGGEAQAVPYEGLRDEGVFVADKAKLIAQIGAVNEWGFTETRKFPIVWTAIVHEDENPIIPLDGRFGEIRDWLAAFAVCWIDSPVERGVHFRIGSDDGYKLYVNHEYIGGLTLSRAAARDQNLHAATLRKGLNLVLLKITDRIGGHEFCLRITDAKGEPYDDLKVILNHPLRELAANCENLDEVDVADGKGFAAIRLGTEPRFPGAMPLSIMLGATEQAQARVQLLVTDSADRELLARREDVSLSPTRAVPVNADITVNNPGPARVDILIQDAKGEKTLAHLTRSFEVLDVQALLRQREALKRGIADRRAKLERMRGELATEEDKIRQSREEVATQHARVEELYAKRREALTVKYGDEARSIDEAFKPVDSPRESICINGDNWEIAAGKYTSGYKIDQDNPPQAGWEPGWVPLLGVEKYFRGYFFPARGKGDPYAPTEVLKCAPEGWTLSDIRIGDGIWHRTKVTIPEGWAGRRVLFETEYAADRTVVFFDGKQCGSHDGWPGRISVELPGATPGEHELIVLTRRARSYGGITHQLQVFGLFGDAYLTSVSDVAVDDTWVITSWRNADVEARVWLLNRGNEGREVTVDCEAVLNGRTRIRLGSAKAQLTPGVTSEVRLRKPWIDPLPWGIGGEYGDPTLYHLVTTVRSGEEILDQQFTRFGFREFWTEGFHYYLNGKRIFIQGDNVGHRFTTRPEQVIWQHLLRDTTNTNLIRCHFEMQQGMYSSVADELGMLIMPQYYPAITVPGRGKAESEQQRLSPEEFLTTETHRENLRLYANWVKWLRNHPSVVIYSTDNEVFTQASEGPDKMDVNIRNDKVAAAYERYVKRLDPTRPVTRDGDEGTWGKTGQWQEDPPAEIANYHYPDFSVDKLVHNWQTTYEKPVLYGETLYCAYGAWDGWIDAIPSQVAAKAQRCREILSLYRDLEVSGWVGMGPGLDCFTELKQDGSGNPFGVSPAIVSEANASGRTEALPNYPYFPITWPSMSGPGLKLEFHRFKSSYGYGSVNAYFADKPVAVLNAVNGAYKESTFTMPPLAGKRPSELLVTVTAGGEPIAHTPVLLTPDQGQATAPVGVVTDSKGMAWFVLREPGKYRASVDGKPGSWIIDAPNLPFKLEAGFNYVPRVSLEVQP